MPMQPDAQAASDAVAAAIDSEDYAAAPDLALNAMELGAFHETLGRMEADSPSPSAGK